MIDFTRRHEITKTLTLSQKRIAKREHNFQK